MKRKTVAKACYVLSVLLLLCFVVKTIIDGVQYSRVINSAPFYVYILLNAFYFVLPAVILFIVGLIIKGKSKK